LPVLISNRRIHPRPYFFELFTVANLLVIHLMFRRDSDAVVSTLPETLLSFGPALVLQAIGGVIVRAVIAALRGELRAYLRIISTVGWITDTVRLLFFGTLMVHVYGWIKLTVPLFHPRLFDQQLWDLDRHLFFGLSPNVFFLDLFSNRHVLAAIDWSYASIFFGSLAIAFGFFLSAPSRRLRIAFITGNSAMWIVGAWLYMAVPSLGPAYGFPDLWFAHSQILGKTQYFQGILLRNYQNVLKIRTTGASVNVLYGIGAFPSLHVGFQAYVLLWMRKLWTYGEIVFGIFVLVIFLGSMVTGWHYMIDGLAGAALAVASYWGASRAFRIRKWLRLSALSS
jgi:PAP2 superfamily